MDVKFVKGFRYSGTIVGGGIGVLGSTDVDLRGATIKGSRVGIHSVDSDIDVDGTTIL